MIYWPICLSKNDRQTSDYEEREKKNGEERVGGRPEGLTVYNNKLKAVARCWCTEKGGGGIADLFNHRYYVMIVIAWAKPFSLCTPILYHLHEYEAELSHIIECKRKYRFRCSVLTFSDGETYFFLK